MFLYLLYFPVIELLTFTVYAKSLLSVTKVSVSGEGALNALEWLCTAPMDNPIGTSKYTLMLNESGGIEADLTVTRISRLYVLGFSLLVL